MPSFRTSIAVIECRAGVEPSRVLDHVSNALGNRHRVEDAFVDVSALAARGGLPRITLRFWVPTSNDADEDAEAISAARLVAAALGEVASWNGLTLTRRSRGRWLPVALTEGPEESSADQAGG